MEFINENLYTLNGRSRIKSKSLSETNTKRSTKTALSDVRNTIHLKVRENEINALGTSKCGLTINELDRNLKSPSPLQKKSTVSKSKKTDLDKMSDNDFTNCRCSEKFDVNNLYTLTEDLTLSTSAIDFFATNWVNNCSDTVNKSFLFSPVEIDEDVLQDMSDSAFSCIMEENEAYLNSLDKNFDLDFMKTYVEGTA